MSVLEVHNVSIRYLTGDFKEIGLKEYVTRKLSNNYHVNEFWADKDVSFTLEKGQMLGIIGSNGAGKSTLLKAVSGIMEPTKGYVKREGSIAALLELGSGFDGDLTVRENTYLRGAMHGYTRKFMTETYDKIIEFAELQDFQDRPFKQLSSGMKSRLAFSIASLVNPDILILDEVLAVGDGAFRKKSEAKMKEIITGGATTILVSHSVAQVRELCDKVLWLHKGEQIAFGDDVEGICDQYEAFLAGKYELPAREQSDVGEKPAAEGAKKAGPVLTTASCPSVRQSLSIPENRHNLILFFAVALFYCIWMLFTYGFSIVNISGDAHDIWKTITTWGTDEVYYSYVLYKGIFSLQPYLWLYRIAAAVGLPGQSLIVVFFSLLYAYSSVYGFPAVISQLMGKGKPIATWKRALFAAVLFQLTKYTYAYSELMVDLPSMAAFLMLIHLAIRLPEAGDHFKHGIQGYGKFLATGLCAGICLGFSGQYSLAVCCIIIFILVKLVRLVRAPLQQAGKYAGIGALLLIAGAVTVIALDTVFSAKIAEEVAASGAFCPSGEWWMERALYWGLQYYQFYAKYIPNVRLTQIAYELYGEAEAIQRFAEARAGAVDSFWSISDYLGAALKYPVDFICNWLNHFFYSISMDQFHQCVPALFASFTSLYISLYGFVTRVKKWGDIFNRNFWIVVGFLSITIPVMVMFVEPRYTISVVGLFLGYTICGDILWQALAGFFRGARDIVQTRSLACLREKKVPMAFLTWIVFIVAAFSWYAALMENCGVNTDILFHW